MSSKPSIRVPRYRLHKGSGQARVTIDGKDHYLGIFNTPESKERYRQVLAEHLGRTPNALADSMQEGDPVNVEEVLAAYWEHAKVSFRQACMSRPAALPTLSPHVNETRRTAHGTRNEAGAPGPSGGSSAAD